jgi:hypothetical protein
MPSSLGLLVVGYPSHLCHSLTGTSEPPPLVPAGPTNEPQLCPQFSSDETSSPSASSAAQTFVMVWLFTPIKRLHSVFTLLGSSCKPSIANSYFLLTARANTFNYPVWEEEDLLDCWLDPLSSFLEETPFYWPPSLLACPILNRLFTPIKTSSVMPTVDPHQSL